ncbi:hypothetical protein FIA58_003055 [Flavobacterium jejuense]|uniref:Carboxypeptidase-like regulatory domain-containing protein n=1 Tax=Flavobacterium jejuense TaxID=1544455 RepID=A0ABX0ILE5_9FLAO|nr:hypothetical protein [Flavobacterium jejuense]NHN24644.1 hypothetical protein [Flavobacterium jejuense]
MKRIFFLFLVILCLNSFSQEKELTILFKDIETQLPVDEVTLTVLRTKESFVSNIDGVVKVLLKRPSYLEVSHSSYKKFIVKSITLNEEENVIYLENTVNKLPEIILTKDHPQNILKGLVENSRNKLSVPSNLRVYIREFFKKNNKNILYNDGLVNFQILKDKSSIKTDILVEQNRVLGILNEKTDKDIYGYNLNNLMENYYKFKYLEEILDSKVKDKYDFQIKSYPENEDYYQLLVKPLEGEEGYLFNYTILYDHNKRIIVEIDNFIDSERAERNSDYSISGKKNVYKSAFKMSYRVKGNEEYYLVYAKEEIGFIAKQDKELIKTEVRNYFVTNKFTKRLFTYNIKDIFKEKTLLNRSNTILTDFWNIDSGLVLTQEEQDFIDSLTEVVEE